MIYGRDSFKKDRGGTSYHIEMDITGGACGIEAGVWYRKTVPAPACTGYEDFADDGRRFGRQTVKEVVSMWRLKFYKAYAKDKKLKRMLAYLKKLK